MIICHLNFKRTKNHNITTTNTSQHVEFFHSLIFLLYYYHVKIPTINYLTILIRVWYLTLIKQLCKGSFTLMRQGHVKSVYFVFCCRHSANITTCCHGTHFFDGRSRHMIGCRFHFMTTLNDGKNYFLLS